MRYTNSMETRFLARNTQQYTEGAVVYVMERDQRVQDNHALLAAQKMARTHNVPLYVVVALHATPGRSREQCEFMLDGLREVEQELQQHNIQFVLRLGETCTVVSEVCHEVACGALFFDFNPLRSSRDAINTLAQTLAIPVTVVDTHNIVPAWVVSDKQEFAAHTIRRKIHRHLEAYLVEPPAVSPHAVSGCTIQSSSPDNIAQFVATLPASGVRHECLPGTTEAMRTLEYVVDAKLLNYAHARNDPSIDGQSRLSPYLHFGHISSLRVALTVMRAVDAVPYLVRYPKLAQAGDAPSHEDGMNALLEELIVRKELSDNFCLYASEYTTLAVAPAWARKTLDDHRDDVRDYVYTCEQWEMAETHDQPWNAAQRQLRTTGRLHGYMRMYWAKKLLEWSATPEDALATALYLNDFYALDGGDPNGYVGILWSIAGLHDRPWFERPVYGKIRYMNSGGLKRKFDLNAYMARYDV